MRRKLASISLGKLRFTSGFNHTIRQFCALVSAMVLFQIAVFAHSSGAFSTETTPPPGWTINPANFQFNKSLVIRARYNNVPTNDPANIVGVFVGTELRGVATPTNIAGQMYFFVTAYSNNFCGEVLNFRTYYAPDDQVYPVMEKDTFCHNGTHGTLAQPFWLNIDPNADFPPFISPIPADTTLRTIPFDPLNLANYSGSPDGDPVSWTAQAGVNLTASIVNGMLTVTPVSPAWVGTDTVRITITENTANHYAASFTASYTVLPFYAAPVFSAIPPQSAYLGGTFNSFDLDNYLTYSGPCRAFGFMSRPYTGTAANPGWAAVPPGAQSMSAIVRPLFGEKTLAGAGAVMAAFVNNILVGKASPGGTAPNIYYSLTLANLASGPITFRFYHAENQYLYEKTTTLNFAPGGSVGSIANPYSLQLAPLVPSLANDGTVQVSIADTTWLGTLPIDFYVWDCAYPLTRRDTATGLFTVSVNNNPEIVSPTTVNFNENTCFELYDAQTIDRNNTEGSGLTYALAGGQDASKFSVNATNGKLSWLNFTPDFEIPGDFNADNHYEVKIKVTNALNLSDTVALTVIVTDNNYETFNPQINGGGQVCFTGSIVLQATGGGTYLWSNSAATSSITVSTSGSYTVTVTNAYACTASVTAVVNAKPSITAAGSSTPICAGSLVNLSSTPTGGSGVYATFSWSGPNNYVATVEDPPGFPALPNVAGTYTVTVTDDKGCTASATTTITVSGSSAPSVTATGTTPVCEGTPVTLTSTPGGGSGTYSMFKWAGPGGYSANVQNPPAFTATQNSSGTYTVTLTDNAGCTATATKVIQVNSKPTVTASSNTPVCTGSTIMLNSSPSGGTGPYTAFTWSGPNNFAASVEDTIVFPALAASSGTYRVTVTDHNGCTGTASTVVAVKGLPGITAGITGATCQGGTLKLNSTPSGGTTPYSSFNWTGPNNFSSPLEDPAAIPLIPAAAGVYTVTVTDASGCTATSSVTATINALPGIVAANSGPVCSGSQLLLSSTPSGGTTPYAAYSWAGPVNYSATVEDPAGFTASNNSGGVYTVTVTDSKGCTSSASTTATVNLKPTITAANNGPFCIGATLNLTSTPAGGSGTYLTYNWTGPNSYTANVEDPAPFSVTLAASGIYRVTVTDSQGCTGTASTTVSVSANSLPSITAASNSPICTATNLALSSTPSGGSGVYSAFSWAGPNSYTANVEDPAPFMASSGNSGVYTVTVTDNKGCTGSGTVTVAVNGPTVNMSKTDLSCFGSNNGTATVSSTGGAPPYTYSWSTGANSATITGLAAGTYTVTLTSSSSGACTAVGMVTISQPPALTASIQQTTPACNNQPSGSALAQGSGGASPFTFKWPASAGNQMTALATGLAAGTYTVTVTDANNCTATASAVITTGTGVSVNSIANVGPACPAGNISLIALSCTPPNSAVNYTWSGGVPAGLSNGSSTGSNPSIPSFTASLTEGVYTVTVTATLGACSSTRTFNVQIDDATLPVLNNCPQSVTLNNTAGQCSTVHSWQAPTATDNCGNVTVNQTAGPASGTTFNVGTSQTVVYTANDNGGNSATCSFTITVNDTQKPTLSCPTSQNFGTDITHCYYTNTGNTLNATATDNCGLKTGAAGLSYNATGASTSTGTTLSGVVFQPGTTTVTWTATDQYNNSATCAYTVVVLDDDAPQIITCPQNQTVSTASNGTGDCTGKIPNLLGALSVSDNCTANNALVITQSPAANATFAGQPGTQQLVTFTVKDAANNSNFCSALLTLADTEAPVYVNCPNQLILNNDVDKCGANIFFTPPSATDNCSGVVAVSQVAGPVPGTYLPVGQIQTINYSALDGAGNTSTCQTTIQVLDSQKPTLFCPGGVQTFSTNNGACSYLAGSALNVNATDNCGISSVVNNFNNSNSLVGASFPIGTTVVSWTATDPAGNTRSCSYSVVVADVVSPTISNCPLSRNVFTNSNGAGDCTGSVPNMVNELFATDNCTNNTGLVVTQSPVAGSLFGAQHNDTRIVTFTVKDAAGNISTCQNVLTIKDNESPVFQTCPTITQVYETDPNQCSAKVNWAIPSAQDNCGGVTVVQTAGPSQGTSLSVGSLHTVTYLATDAPGNTGTCQFSIQVVDGQKPTLFCPGGIQTIGTNTGCTYAATATLNISATDNCSNSTLTNTFNNSNSLVGAAFPIGSTLVTWTATDASGNSQTCSYTVVITDDDFPTITTCPPSRNVNSNGNSTGDCTGSVPNMLPELVATDNCSAPGTLVITQSQAPGSTFGAQHNDTRVVTFTVTDASGNSSTCQATLTLKDNEPPVFQTCPTSTLVFETDPDQCSAKVNWIIPSAQDNCGSSTVIQTAGPVLGTSLAVGPLHSVTYQATDAAGNSSTCSFSIRVLDGQKPTLFCPGGNQTFGTNNGNCSYQANSVLNIAATDNCSISTLTNTFNNGNSLTNAVFPQGTTLVTWTATDASNNTQTCSYTVVVTDDDAPTISTCPPSRNINSNGNGAGDCTGQVPNMISEVQANDNCSVQANLIITQTPPAGSVFGAQHNDTRVVTFSVKDPAGNISTCQNILTLKDNELPAFQTCPTTMIMVGTDPDQCSAKLNWAIPSAQDNCGTVTVTQTAGPLPGSIVQATCPPAPTTVTYTANDNNGNSGTVCTFEVLVRDLQKPTFKANVLMPGDITVECDAVPVNNVYHNNVLSPLVNNDVQDNCTSSTDLVLNYNQISTQGPDPMLCSYYNYTLTRTWTVTDCAANTLSHTQVITVHDTQKPTAVCKNLTITLDDFGMNGFTPKELDGGSTDNCAANANLTFTASQTAFDCAHLGANNITLTVTDPCGNFNTCVAVVTIVEGNGKCKPEYDAQGSDPCVCLNNATTLENGQFSELIQVHALAGQTWTLSANSGLYSVASLNPPAAPLLLPLGTVLTNGQFDGIDNNGNGQIDEQSERVYYTLRARHVEGVGYTATVTNGAQPITLSNKCYYPTPIFTNLDDPFCLNTPAFQIQVGENYGASGTVVSITVNGVATNIFDAGALGIGSYEVVVIFDAGPAQPFLVVDGVVIQGSDAAALADPGCQQKISQFVQVVGTPTSVICNDLVYVSLDADCTETLLPDDVLEGTYFCYDDYILELDKVLPLGNGPWGAPIVNTSDIGHVYAYRITHAILGNICNGLIKVEDKLPPALKCPDDITVACSESTETQHTGNVLIEDCSPTNTVIDDVLTDFGECSIPRAKIVRTWIVNDAWNNQSTCSQTITITPFDFADLVFPANVTVDCESSYGNPTALHPDVTGAPSINGFPIGSGGLCTASIGYTDQRLDICAGSYELLRTWVVRNTCLPLGPNNPVEHTQIIQVKDFGGPVFTCPPAVTVSTDPFQCCATAPLPDMIISEGCSQISDLQAKVTGTDPANGNIITFTVPGHLGDFAGNNYWNPDTLAIFPYTQCLPLGTYTVQYTAADQCGNTSLCSFQMTVADLIPPTAACDQWTQVDLGGDGMALVNASTFDDGSKDNCAPVEFKVRRMQANDCQSDTVFYDQVKFCCSDINDTIRVVFRVYDVDVPAGNVTLEGYEGHYNDCMVQVLVNDKIKPICIPPANTTVDCENFDPSLWAYGAASAQDNCCIDTITTTATYTQFDTVCNRGTITRTFKAFDCGGLSSLCTQRVIVNYLQDYYVKFPNDAIVTSCDGTGIFGEPAFFGKDCELLGVSFEDQIFTVVPDACFKIERTWKIINWCTFNPNAPLTYVPNPNPNSSSTSAQNLPGPVVSYVNAQAPWAPTVVKINPTDAVTTNYSVYWSANANGYEYNQVIKITDTQDPVAENCPDSLVTYCDVTPNDPLLWNESYWWDNLIGQHDLCEGPADLSIAAGDACSGANINIHYLLYLDLDQDGAMETVVNSLSTGVAGGLPWNTVFFGNINSPNFIGGTARSFDGRAVPGNQKYGFALQTTVQGNKRIATVRWNTQQNQNTFVVPELPYGKHKIKWIIEDGCGNESFCEYNFEVKDCKKPSVVCLNGLSVNIMPNGMITLWASDFLKYTDDNCTPADKIKSGIRRTGAGTGFPVDGNGNPLTHVDFICDDLGTQTVELWGLDLAGNADYCETYVIVQDNAGNCVNDPNAAKVAGTLETEAGDGVQAGSVEISGSGNAIPSFSFATMSDSLGWYNFNGIPKSSNSTVTPLKDDNPLNGVSTYDLLLISKHILSTEPLNSPLKLIAADANHSGTVTTFDIVQLRKLILGIYTDIPNNTSWRFIDKNFVFPNPLDPFETQFPETKLIADLQTNQVSENFVAIKVGDVNGSAIPNALMAADDRTVGSLLFDVRQSKENVETGELFTVALTPDQVVQGYQFTLNINGLEVADIAGIKTENYAVFEDAVTFSVDGKDALGTISLTFKARRSGKLSEMLSVSSRITKAEAYAQIPNATLHPLPTGEGRGGALNIALRFHENGVSTVSGLGFELYQNQPNPFVDKTVIGFYLPVSPAEVHSAQASESSPTTATLSIYDETGRLLYTRKAAFASGYNHFVVEKSQLHTAGMMYYKVGTETGSATKKMLMEQ